MAAMTAPAFDTLATARDLEAAALRADFYRALWIQGGAIVATIAALAGLIAGAGQ